MKLLKIIKDENNGIIIPCNSVVTIDYNNVFKTVQINFLNDENMVHIAFQTLGKYEEFVKNIFKYDVEITIIKLDSYSYSCNKINVMK